MQEERRVVNDTGLTTFFSKVYGTMGVGLLITGLVSYVLGVMYQVQYINFVVQNRFLYWVALFLPLVLSFMMSSKRAQANVTYARGMFFLMAASYGFTLATLFISFRSSIILLALVVTAVVFFTMSAVGRLTHKDMSRMGSMALSALLGVLIISLLNMLFFHSTMTQMLIAYAVMIIFIVMTAADTQTLKRFYMTASSNGDYAVNLNSLAVQGALMLYLDFLNLFLAIVQIFGFASDN